MNMTGADLAVRALEHLGIRWTFGIPGVHNTELYDALDRSPSVTPVLVTHEGGAAFMADAVSRTSSSVGCLAIVPAAGVTHAMSGIGEAFLDGIPMLIIAGGIRRDTDRAFQLHDIDQLRLVDGVVKSSYRVATHADIAPTLYRAYADATRGEPGPSFVEIPADLLMFPGPAPEPGAYVPARRAPSPDVAAIAEAAEVLAAARHPGIYVGWGARHAVEDVMAIAARLGAPVATTLQGLGAFPGDHPLHVGMGFGNSAVPVAREAFAGCDVLLAVGVRFAELATGSYGMSVPANLLHVDINPAVFGANYPARVAIEADAVEAMGALQQELEREVPARRDYEPLAQRIAAGKAKWSRSWTEDANSSRVSPGRFFAALRTHLARDGIVVADDGNHTFLVAEQFPVYQSGAFISPSDFNCMGYCVPAAIGARLANPDRDVAAVVGDGGFLMTAMEIVTAVTLGLGVAIYVFSDGELAQISQFQQIPLNRKTCTVLGQVDLEGVARATGAEFMRINDDREVAECVQRATGRAATGRPVIVDVRIDYSRKTAFTKGVVKTNLHRFSLGQKARFVGRAVKRHFVG
jgi:acetolactate synthase-1/2/3 large subunit